MDKRQSRGNCQPQNKWCAVRGRSGAAKGRGGGWQNMALGWQAMTQWEAEEWWTSYCWFSHSLSSSRSGSGSGRLRRPTDSGLTSHLHLYFMSCEECRVGSTFSTDSYVIICCHVRVVAPGHMAFSGHLQRWLRRKKELEWIWIIEKLWS